MQTALDQDLEVREVAADGIEERCADRSYLLPAHPGGGLDEGDRVAGLAIAQLDERGVELAQQARPPAAGRAGGW